MDKINPKDCQVVETLGDSRFLQFLLGLFQVIMANPGLQSDPLTWWQVGGDCNGKSLFHMDTAPNFCYIYKGGPLCWSHFIFQTSKHQFWCQYFWATSVSVCVCIYIYMRVEQKVLERGFICVSLWVCNEQSRLKFFLKWRKYFFFWLKFWRKFM